MVCISRRPRCGTETGTIVPEPLSTIAAWLGTIIGVITAIVAVLKALGAISVAGGLIKITSGSSVIVLGTAAGAGVLAGLVTVVALTIIIGTYVIDRCVQGEGLAECIGGVAQSITESFNSTLDTLLPFSAMHDRVDVVAKSRYWDVVEDGNAFVYCTEHPPPSRSEIIRCYFYDASVCNAAEGAQIGAGVAAVPAIIAAALVAAAIGCATVFLCLIAIIVAALVAATVVLVGALIGGHVAKGDPDSNSPTAGGQAITTGHLITVHGSMKRRENDNNANVIYWASSANYHGISMSPRPFSYCEIDDELPTDGCGVPPVIIL